jgi:hypothetical protein
MPSSPRSAPQLRNREWSRARVENPGEAVRDPRTAPVRWKLRRFRARGRGARPRRRAPFRRNTLLNTITSSENYSSRRSKTAFLDHDFATQKYVEYFTLRQK